MASGKPFVQPTRWVQDSDETTIIASVTVTQTMGVSGRVAVQRHHLREDAYEAVYATLRGNNKDDTFPELIRALRHLLDTAEKVWRLEEERRFL